MSSENHVTNTTDKAKAITYAVLGFSLGIGIVGSLAWWAYTSLFY
ncbi:hypothetical protein [Lysinibacillus xylanilyticus]